jgi:hypothetical protein
MKEQNAKIAQLIGDTVIYIKKIVMKNYNGDMPFSKFLKQAFNTKDTATNIKNLNFLQKEMKNNNYEVTVVNSIEGTYGSYAGLFFGKEKLFDEETQSEINVDVFFSTQVDGTLAYYQNPNTIIICASILNDSADEIYGTIYHEIIHATQPTKVSPRRYKQSRIISGKPGRVRLSDRYNYIRPGVEFEAKLGGLIHAIKNNFKFLYNKAPNNALWQKTKKIQLDNIKNISKLSRKDVLREFSLNYTEGNRLPYPNSIIPSTSLYALELIYYASIGEEKTATSNVGRLRWNQLINAFKQLYKELSRDKAYATK